MVRMLVVLGNVFAVEGAVACGFVHLLSLIGLAPALSGVVLALAVLAVFPLGGFAILLLLRVGRTYRVWGNDQLNFVTQRAPKVTRRLIQLMGGYALIHFVILLLRRSPETLATLAASPFVAWFYLVLVAVFVVGLRDPRIVPPRTNRAEPRPPLALQ